MAKAFNAYCPKQEAAGLKSIFRTVSQTDSSTVMVILEAEPGISVEYMEENLNVEASAHILWSEEFLIGWHKKHQRILIKK